MSLKDMAKERGVTKATIISHLEKLQAEKVGDIAYLKPKSLTVMKKAFGKEKKLSDAHKKSKGKYTYEDLRLARLFL